MDNFNDNDLKDLGLKLAEVAYEIFCLCDAESDFCIQNAEGGVFGGVNRIIFNGQWWSCSTHHSSDEFVNKFTALVSGGFLV